MAPSAGVCGEGESAVVQPAGVASDVVWRFVEQLGLAESTVEFLGRLPEDLQNNVIRGFNPSGTKDGNVWGRLLGYARSLWSRRLGLTEPASTFVRGLPEEVQVAVILDFDATGSKDGNVSARLVQFANYLIARSTPSRAPVGAPPAQPQSVVQPVTSCMHPQAPVTDPLQPAQGSVIGEFAQALGLDASATVFLQALPEEVQSTVITTFDPSGTKDGNIWCRLLAFVRRVCVRYAGVDKASFEHLKTLTEDEQKRLMVEWTVQHVSYKPTPSVPQSQWDVGQETVSGDSAIERFSHVWGLDGRAVHFLQALPEPVRDHVIAGFDGSGTKDGNVWGRLLGFARHTWARSLGLDQASVAFIKTLPEEAQMICLTDFDPSGTKDGNIAGRLQGFAKKALAQASARVPTGASNANYVVNATSYSDVGVARAPVPMLKASLSSDPLVMGFLERCGLDMSTVSYLESLPEDVLARVLSDFDPSGTKDGNVLGRLQGYVRFLNARRKRTDEDLGGPQAKRQRFAGVY